MNTELKTRLVEDGCLTDEQLRQIEDHAKREGVSPSSAALALDLITTEKLGECMSGLYELPYMPLRGRSISAGARSALSHECAEAWNVFPLDHDPLINLLTVTVTDPESALTVERVSKFFLESYDVAFTVSTAPEIEHAINVQFDDQRDSEAGAFEQKKITTVRIPKASLKRFGGSDSADTDGGREEPAVRAAEFVQALTSAVSLLVAAHLEDSPKQLAKARERARYCQLISDRSQLAPDERTKTILAAWISALDEKRGVIKQLVTPYDLESVVYPPESDDDPGIAAQIVALVRCYEEIEDESRGESWDVNAVRRNLLVRWSAAVAHQDLLEIFLQVLMDEQFLGDLDQSAGTILIVDSSGTMVSEIEGPLGRAGYQVQAVASTSAAVSAMADAAPDMVIAHADNLAKDVLVLCKDIKSGKAGADIPILVLQGDASPVRGAEFIRAGAGDVLTAPIDIEMLYLRVEKELAASVSDQSSGKEGVSGSLADMSFSDMIQMLTANCKNTELKVSRGDESGLVIMREGNVIHAEVGDVVGEKAFYVLMPWVEGEFSMTECREFPEPTVNSSTMSLLMEGARLADEGLSP